MIKSKKGNHLKTVVCTVVSSLTLMPLNKNKVKNVLQKSLSY